MSVKITERITSRKNPTVVEVSKLGDRKQREALGVFVLEGIKLFEEAVCAKAVLRYVFVTDTALEKYGDILERSSCDKIFSVSDEVFSKLSSENAPQGILAVAEFFRADGRIKSENPFALVLDGVSDPGNLGTIIRCADALGAECVYIGDGGVDLYNPKTVRACMGSLFRVKTERCNAVKKISELRKNGYSVYAAMLDDGACDVRDIDLGGKVGLVIGNEGHGISDEVAAVCDKKLIIPMTEGIQSLNAAVAASLLMWEAARTRL